MKNSFPRFLVPQYYILLCLVITAHTLQAQDNDEKLDVYKIEFTSTGIAAEGNKSAPSMLVFCHPDYLNATETGAGLEKTSWLVWYKKKKLLKIDGKRGLPLNYNMQLKTNVHLPGEAIDSTGEENGTGDWDNENEYNTPGEGVVSLTKDTMTIKGFLCRKATIQYHFDAQCTDGLIHWIEIWYSPDLPQFYLPPFAFLQKIPGAALMITLDDGNETKVGYKADRITKQQENISFFRPSEDIRILYPPKLK